MPSPWEEHAREVLLAETWGRRLYEAQADGPTWAADVLAAAQSCDPGLPEVDAVITTARDPARRHLGHAVFDRARRRLLAEQEAGGRLIRKQLLSLAELVAKAAYNDTNPTGPFDFDSPWYIATTVVALAAAVGDADYMRQLRDALGDWPDQHRDPEELGCALVAHFAYRLRPRDVEILKDMVENREHVVAFENLCDIVATQSKPLRRDELA